MKSKDTSKDLTLILLLKDRAQFTWRWMHYVNHFKLPFKVIIADGGKDKSVESLADPSLYPNVNYEYIRYPYDENALVFFRKMADALSKVKTPYVVFQACNDDFYFTDGLIDAVKFLNANPDYVVARGDIYSFVVESPKNKPEELNHIYGEFKDFCKMYENPSNTAISALERFRVFSYHSNTLWLDVCRTEIAFQVFKILCELEIKDLKFAEYFTNALISASGKIYRGPGLYMLHQGHQDTVGLMLTKWDPFEWVESEPWISQFLKLLNALAKKISEIDKIPEQEAYNKTLQYYLANTLGRNVVDRILEKTGRKSPTITKLGHFLSANNPLRKHLKGVYLKIKRRKQKRENKKLIESSPYYKELEQIEDFLRSENKHE